jgi:hypothetical protein
MALLTQESKQLSGCVISGGLATQGGGYSGVVP